MSQLYSLSLINIVNIWILHTLKLCFIHILPSTAINLNLNQLSGETSNSNALIKCWQLSRSLLTQTVSLKNFALHLKSNGSDGSCTRNSHRIYDYRLNAGLSLQSSGTDWVLNVDVLYFLFLLKCYLVVPFVLQLVESEMEQAWYAKTCRVIDTLPRPVSPGVSNPKYTSSNSGNSLLMIQPAGDRN